MWPANATFLSFLCFLSGLGWLRAASQRLQKPSFLGHNAKNTPKNLQGKAKGVTLQPYSRGHLDYNRFLGYGVIGNTTDSGPVFPGSSPGTPTKTTLIEFAQSAFFCWCYESEERIWNVERIYRFPTSARHQNVVWTCSLADKTLASSFKMSIFASIIMYLFSIVNQLIGISNWWGKYELLLLPALFVRGDFSKGDYIRQYP